MWLLFAILSSIFDALTSILSKIGIDGVNSNLATAIRTIVALVMAWEMFFLTNAQTGLSTIGKKLAVSGFIRVGYGSFMAVLLQSASYGRSIKGGSNRQVKRCNYVGISVCISS